MELSKHGYEIVDNFIPHSEALKLESLYSNHKEWSLADQVRDDLYTTSHFQSARTKSKYLPNSVELQNLALYDSSSLGKYLDFVRAL